MNHIFNTCPSFDGHVAWLHFLVTVSIEAVNMDEHMSVAGCRVLGMQNLLRRFLVLRNLLNRPHTAQETAPRINKWDCVNNILHNRENDQQIKQSTEQEKIFFYLKLKTFIACTYRTWYCVTQDYHTGELRAEQFAFLPSHILPFQILYTSERWSIKEFIVIPLKLSFSRHYSISGFFF